MAPTLVIYGLGMLIVCVSSLVSYVETHKPNEVRYYARWFWIGLVWPIACLVWLAKHVYYLWINAWGKDA